MNRKPVMSTVAGCPHFFNAFRHFNCPTYEPARQILSLCSMRLLLLLLTAAFTSMAQAQTTAHQLEGFMAVAGGETFTYRLELEEGAGGELKGYAYTYVKEGKDVKAAVEGHIDRTKKTVSFRETDIVYNHGFESKAVLCLVDATLKFMPDESGGITLSGAITSNTASNALCGKGSIVFTDAAMIAAVFQPVAHAESPAKAPAAPAPAPEKQKPVRIVYDTARRAPAPATPRQEEVTAGKTQTYQFSSDSVWIEIWDGGKLDGDIITVLLNERPVLARYTLTADKKQLRLPLQKGQNTLIIIADNEGNEPPTTADILLHDGDKQYRLLAHNRIGREAVIHLIRP